MLWADLWTRGICLWRSFTTVPQSLTEAWSFCWCGWGGNLYWDHGLKPRGFGHQIKFMIYFDAFWPRRNSALPKVSGDALWYGTGAPWDSGIRNILRLTHNPTGQYSCLLMCHLCHGMPTSLHLYAIDSKSEDVALHQIRKWHQGANNRPPANRTMVVVANSVTEVPFWNAIRKISSQSRT